MKGGRWALPAVFALFIALFYWPEVSGRTILYPADEIASDWGGAREFAEGIFRGELRLWSDRYFTGFPLVAFLRMGPLYPLKIPFFGIFDVVAATQRTLWLHLLLMALFTHAYARELGASRSAGVLAGAVYAFNGFTADYYHALHGVTTFAWLPAVLLCAERWTKTADARWLAGLSASMGLHWLGGHTQYAYYTTLLLPFYALLRARAEARPAWASRAMLALVAGGVGVALAAPQILPAMDLRAQAARALIDYEHAVAGGGNNLGAKELVEHLLPLARGGRHADAFAPGYFGFAALVFALVSVLRPRTPILRLWTGAALVALLLAAGKNTPVFRALYALGLPGFGSFHDPQRAQLPAIFGLGVLGALGLDAFLRALREGGPERKLAPILAAALLAGAFALHLGAPEPLRAASRVHLAVFAAIAGVIALASIRGGAPALAPVLAALAFANLWIVNRPLLPGAAAERPRAPTLAATVAEELGDARYFGEGADAWANNKGAAIGLAHVSGEDSLAPLRFLQLTRLREDVDPAYQTAYGDFLASPAALRLLRTRAILAQRAPERERVYQNPDSGEALYWDEPRFDAARQGYEAFAEADSIVAWRAKAPPPRAWCAPHARGETLSATLAALRDPAFDPAALALLEAGAGELEGAPCEATLRSDGRGGWSLRVRGGGPMTVVMADAMLPGLRATREGGEPARLFPAFAHLRALRLPAGDHRVRIVYDPPSFRLGWLLGTLAATLTAGAFLARRRASSRPPAAGAPSA